MDAPALVVPHHERDRTVLVRVELCLPDLDDVWMVELVEEARLVGRECVLEPVHRHTLLDARAFEHVVPGEVNVIGHRSAAEPLVDPVRRPALRLAP